MSLRGSNNVSRIVQTVANGEGDWSALPQSLRDSIVIAITEQQPSYLGSQAAYGSQLYEEPVSLAPPPLSEGVVQSSVETFDDAAWVRAEAVRSYTQFHNSIEALHSTMHGQLHPVWRTAMQLHPDILRTVRHDRRLNQRDSIPDGVPIPPAALQHLAQQEMVLLRLENDLQVLRNASVRFAAHFLTDEEKMAFGANPAYLRPVDIDKEVESVYDHTSVSLSRSRSHRESRARAARHSTSATRSSSGAPAARRSPSSTRQKHHHRHLDLSANGRRRHEAKEPVEDPLLQDLRMQYKKRLSDLHHSKHRDGDPERTPVLHHPVDSSYSFSSTERGESVE